jgi:predicted dehydrogenase
MTKTSVNIAMIGSGFMGRAHSNGYRQARAFFDLPVEPVMKVLGARNEVTGPRLAEAYGWQEVIQDWRDVVTRSDVDVVDIVTPVYTHAEIAEAALAEGKAVICEKPLAGTLEEAKAMNAAAESAGVPTMCNYNMRATPAIALARRMIENGAIGEINQWRAAFMQGWLVNEDFPLTWRLKKELAGSGALGDLGSHSIDMARFLVDEIAAVAAMWHTFTEERPIPVDDVGRNSVPSGEMGEVTVDDSVWTLLRFEKEAFGTMEATRMATGQLCSNRFEVYGSEGGLTFDFMRLNELQYFSLEDPAGRQGWRTIHATQPNHPYVEAWWPAGHSLGYEHTFPHLLVDFFEAYAADEMPNPDFSDALRTQAVMEAVEKSSKSGNWEAVPEVDA